MIHETSSQPGDQPLGPLPEVLFPSPIVDEYFDPYTDAADRADYLRLGGSRDAILIYTSIKKVRELRLTPGAYPDHDATIASVLDSVDHIQRKRRIEQHFRPGKP